MEFMKFEDLLDLPLRQVLKDYVCVYNLECGGYYGIFSDKDIEKIFDEYNINEDYPEAFAVEELINEELLFGFEEPVRDYDTLLRIMDNLGISKKTE